MIIIHSNRYDFPIFLRLYFPHNRSNVTYEPFIWHSSTRVKFVISIIFISSIVESTKLFPSGNRARVNVQQHATATRKLKVPQNSSAAHDTLNLLNVSADKNARTSCSSFYHGRRSCHPRDSPPSDFEQLAFNPHRISCSLLREWIVWSARQYSSLSAFRVRDGKKTNIVNSR